MLIAESRGRIAHDFRVFFMGHRGSMEARYTTNKGVLPDVLLDEMRDAFVTIPRSTWTRQKAESYTGTKAGGARG